jgi:hypothetical protein
MWNSKTDFIVCIFCASRILHFMRTVRDVVLDTLPRILRGVRVVVLHAGTHAYDINILCLEFDIIRFTNVWVRAFSTGVSG